ncbi:MAG: aminoacyl-tRNA hydrolase, partial [Acidimicrobiia bacterium]|nr:aminoacyl-tRNA hydrolase [Acidimicrobiia bacterium]
RPPASVDPADFVLRRFSMVERGEVDLMVEWAADIVTSWKDYPARAQETAARYNAL